MHFPWCGHALLMRCCHALLMCRYALSLMLRHAPCLWCGHALPQVDANLAAAGFTGSDFDAVVAADKFEAIKPAPDIFLAAARLMGVPAHDCVVVEDAAAGIQAARNAGAPHCCLKFQGDGIRRVTCFTDPGTVASSPWQRCQLVLTCMQMSGLMHLCRRGCSLKSRHSLLPALCSDRCTHPQLRATHGKQRLTCRQQRAVHWLTVCQGLDVWLLPTAVLLQA